MTKKLPLVLIVILAYAVSLPAQQAHYAQHGPALLPDSMGTPGSVAITDKSTICTIKWGKDERHVTAKMKEVVYARYGTAAGQGDCQKKSHTGKNGNPVQEGCQVDHLISRELGGADVIENLWPQPYTQHPGAHEKDWLENRMHKEVCSGGITLSEAQQEIKADWYAAYLKRTQPK
jgi:hypothetical protein